MARRVLALTDPAARDGGIAGAKAAGLARASAAGLPVLPGVVLPVGESEGVVRAAAGVLDSADSDVRARLAAMQVQPDLQLVAELRQRLAGFGAPLIVRSSSPLEADGAWSGAFSTFHGITTDDLGPAVRGCWGSAFSVGVLSRARETGTAPRQLGLAVLIQPELRPEVGGTARLKGDGSVVVTSTRGPLRPLMAGDVEGAVSRVAEDGSISTTDDDPALVTEVAALVRRVHAVLDHHLIEWAAVDGQVHLLQSIRAEESPRTGGDVHAPDPALAAPVAVRTAHLVQAFPGQLGYQLVLPWAVALDGRAHTPERSDLDPRAALAAAQSGAAALTAQLWGGSPRAAAVEADRVLRMLRGHSPATAVARLERLPQPTGARAAAVLGHLEVVRRAALDRGVVDHDAAFWRLGPDELHHALSKGRAAAASRLGVDRWEPFVHRVVTATGTRHEGVAVVPGAGAGRPYLATETMSGPAPTGRHVIVAGRPSPSLGPLLWSAAGLVTRAGSPAAHLIEFARSIGVPAVVGCDVPELLSSRALVAVDGDRGTVSVLEAED
jgi:phosphohistidine swiveling domain-containing protein